VRLCFRFVCLSVSRKTQKAVNEFTWNCCERKVYFTSNRFSILVLIRIQKFLTENSPLGNFYGQYCKNFAKSAEEVRGVGVLVIPVSFTVFVRGCQYSCTFLVQRLVSNSDTMMYIPKFEGETPNKTLCSSGLFCCDTGIATNTIMSSYIIFHTHRLVTMYSCFWSDWLLIRVWGLCISRNDCTYLLTVLQMSLLGFSHAPSQNSSASLCSWLNTTVYITLNNLLTAKHTQSQKTLLFLCPNSYALKRVSSQSVHNCCH